MMLTLFIFEQKKELTSQMHALLGEVYTINTYHTLEHMTDALLSEEARDAIVFFNWDNTEALTSLQKIRFWQRLIPIVVVAGPLPWTTIISLLNSHVYDILPKQLTQTTLRNTLQALTIHYDKLTLQNIRLFSIRHRKFVFNRALRQEELQSIFYSMHNRDTAVDTLPLPETFFKIPKPKILIIDPTPSTLCQTIAETHTLIFAKTVSEAQDILQSTAIDLVLFDPAAHDGVLSEFFTATGCALVAVFDAHKSLYVIDCFKEGAAAHIDKNLSEHEFKTQIQQLLTIKWESEAGGDIALPERQYLFANYCRVANTLAKPILWSDWQLFFQRTFPDPITPQNNAPIPYTFLCTSDIQTLSALPAPLPHTYTR